MDTTSVEKPLPEVQRLPFRFARGVGRTLHRPDTGGPCALTVAASSNPAPLCLLSSDAISEHCDYEVLM